MLILTDLDDTLFQTRRKCPSGDGELTPMSFLADGSESGYATTKQAEFMAWLNNGVVVPVTARSREVLGRVKIKQEPAITSNGGCIILADGQVDKKWHAILETAAAVGESVQDVYHRMTAGLDAETFRHWIVSENGLDLYVVIKDNVANGASLDQIQASIPEGWRVHRNGNNLAFLPGWLNKRDAVRYLIAIVRQRDGEVPIIGAGDSHSDVGFMDLCDFAMTPTNSQLWKSVIKESNWC
ncbi:sucrose-6-phosphate hydrolase [Sphingomonas sp. 179-I 2A4 NHS]|uniref:sucrose-6-phosphate hydrolase n=1 Tax=unclassified Sphingomonas TaxID=196159 RepID=UPI0038794EDE